MLCLRSILTCRSTTCLPSPALRWPDPHRGSVASDEAQSEGRGRQRLRSTADPMTLQHPGDWWVRTVKRVNGNRTLDDVWCPLTSSIWNMRNGRSNHWWDWWVLTCWCCWMFEEWLPERLWPWFLWLYFSQWWFHILSPVDQVFAYCVYVFLQSHCRNLVLFVGSVQSCWAFGLFAAMAWYLLFRHINAPE